MHWLAQGLRKVQAEPGIVNTELKEASLNFVQRRKKRLQLQFISSFRLGTSGLPVCYPLTVVANRTRNKNHTGLHMDFY